jgi:hypothetical protein
MLLKKKRTLKKFIFPFILLTVFLSNTGLLQAQQPKVINLQGYDKQPYHFGFVLGTGAMMFRSSSDSLHLGREMKTAGPSFTVGILGNLRLAEHFDLRLIPALSMSSARSIINYGTNYEQDSSFSDFRTILLVLPLEIKARSKRYNNMAAYVLAGMAYTYDFSNKSVADAKIRLPKSDFLPEVGVGVDLYTEYFKFGIEAKMAYGLTNLNRSINTDTGNPIAPDDFKSKIFFLTFTFE